jgi:hypothetical protein
MVVEVESVVKVMGLILIDVSGLLSTSLLSW